jgi:hypothetical protein
MWHSVIVVLACAVGACRASQVDKLTAIKARVCACKTSSCGETALREVPQDIESNHRTQAIAHDMMECLARLYEAERPSDSDDQGGDGATGPETAAPASARTP